MWQKPYPTGACLGKGSITINDIIAASHSFVARHLAPGSVAVDATAGNGNDTVFLAQQVGSSGIVHAFDIQEIALKNTRALLEQHGLARRVMLHGVNHRTIAQVVTGPVQAVMFNLGYLPGGDKEIKTRRESSLEALHGCLGLLAPGGIISVVTYSGHAGGKEEEDQVATWCQGLDARCYTAMGFSLQNKPNRPPKLWLVKTKNC